LSGNSATSNGGGIYNFAGESNGRITITNSTLSSNSAPNGGGIYNSASGGSATVTLANTILKTGSSGQNILNISGQDRYTNSTVTSNGYNLSDDDGGGLLN
jgi:hypothetical protein